jgi:predicted membrane chloride channel (bestrophin family)
VHDKAMQITRNHHATFMVKVMPLLTLCYFIQSYFILKYAPLEMSRDVVAMVGLGLLSVFIYYYLYDRFHEVVLHSSHLVIRIAPLNIQHEYLYREIMDVEIQREKKEFGHVIIHLRNGDKHKLAHVDDASRVRKFLLERC